MSKGAGIPTGESSTKAVGMPDGRTKAASIKVNLPMNQLVKGAWAGDKIPGIRNNLISVSLLENFGYTTVFWPQHEGVDVYNSTDVEVITTAAPVLRWWRDNGRSGLWHVPMTHDDPMSEEEFAINDIELTQAQVNNIYNLPSTEVWVAYVHACLGFPTKRMLLEEAAAGRLVGIPFATANNIRRLYPEKTATPKGNMDQQLQRVRATRKKGEGERPAGAARKRAGRVRHHLGAA